MCQAVETQQTGLDHGDLNNAGGELPDARCKQALDNILDLLTFTLAESVTGSCISG